MNYFFPKNRIHFISSFLYHHFHKYNFYILIYLHKYINCIKIILYININYQKIKRDNNKVTQFLDKRGCIFTGLREGEGNETRVEFLF